MKWWEVVPVGSTLTELDPSAGEATFEATSFSTISAVHGPRNITRSWRVDLWSDEVLS